MRRSLRFSRFACLFLAAFGFSTLTHAQGYDPNVLTSLPKSVYHGSDIDHIDLAGGNLRIAIPLLHLPGRGIDTDIQLTYNSKIWNAWEADDPDLGSWYFTQGSASANSMGALGPAVNGNGDAPAIGWGADIARMGQFGNYIQVCQSFVGGSCQKYVEYRDWAMSEGTVIPTADDVGSETIFPNQPDVGLWSFAGDYTRFPGVAGVIAANLTTGFYKDGTKVSDSFAAPAYTRIVSITDTNGNFISCMNPSPYTTKTCTDTLGRTITYNYGSSLPHVLQTITYKDSSGTLQTITFSYQGQAEHLPNSWISGVDTGVCVGPCITSHGGYLTLASVTLPNGRSYQFQYLPCPDGDGFSTGLVSQVTLPTGGYIKYTWNSRNVFLQPTGPQSILYVPATRVVSSDGTAGTEKTWTYSISDAGPNQVTDPLGNIELITLDGNSNPTGSTFKDSSGHVLRTVSRTLGSDQSAYNDPNTICPPKCTSNARTLSETTTLNDTNQQSKVTYTYGSRGNVTEKDEYDWGSGAPGALVRKTNYTYLRDGDTTYDTSSVHILDRITSRNVCNSAGTFCSKQTTTYDGATPTSTTNIVSHDYTNFPASFTKRGNSTLIQNWLNTTSTWLPTTNVFNDVGNLLQTTDPQGNITTFNFTDNYYNYTPPQPTSAFVTQVTLPVTSGVNHIVKSQYYFYSGLPSATCGQNFPSAAACAYGLAPPQSDYTQFTYDGLNRSLSSTSGDGGQISLAYNEASLPLGVTATTKITSALSRVETATYDGLARLSQSKLTSDPQGTIYMVATYDALGRINQVYNPTRCNPPTSNCGEPTWGYTTKIYDSLGRVCVVVPPDGTAVSGGNCPTAQPTNDIFTTYSGNTTTVKDQAGKSRKSVSDGLGRLTQVFEDPSGLNYETDYTYDTLDNLLTVNQKGNDPSSANWRTRTFTYNSLSQLLTASNPESGTITYTYNNDGTLATKVAPAPNQTGSLTVTTTYSNDSLHRLTQKSYSDGSTPAVKYGYDAVAPSGCTLPTLTINNGIGKRTGMCDAAGAEAWSYDISASVGWLITDARTTNSVAKSTIVQNNLAGSPATLTYPSGRIITYAFDAAARPVSAIDSTGPINYATAATYTPPGSLASLTNGASIISTYFYNNRVQPCRISVKNTGTAPSTCTDAVNNGNVLDFTYNFSMGTADNGNVIAITNNRDLLRSQSFTYDALNRLATAQTSATFATGPTKCWGEQFTYDSWANFLSITSSGSPYTGCTQESLSTTATTKNQISGFCYDAAGNLLAQSAPPCPSPTYTYNAENQMTLTAGVTYTYDGDGKRVQKSSGKLYWYGMGSDPLDETDLAGNTNNASFNEYIFFGGKRIARRDYSNNVNYYFADHLGTARIVADSSGTVLDDSDFYPFGGERSILTSSGNPYKFTGKERDAESTLDNFGARYFSSAMGRFTSPDPDGAGSLEQDPQSWNMYAYARNNPLRYTDPDGRSYDVCVDNGNGGQNCVHYKNDADFESAAAKSGATLQDGNILVNGQVIGSYKHNIDAGVENGGTSEDNILAPALLGGLIGGIRAGIRGLGEAIFGGGVKTVVEETAVATAEQVVSGGTKQAVREALESSGLSDAAKAAVKSALRRGAAGDKFTVEKLADGSVKIIREVAGKAGGRAAYEQTIDGASGLTKEVVQKAYDAAGNLVHVDPKFP